MMRDLVGVGSSGRGRGRDPRSGPVARRQWHQSPSGQGQNSTLNPPDNIMDPWRFAEADTRDLATFGYTYA